ncbi:Hypp9115 [Branchiostoma lanceolatum]|uniref:Hypp9115 protein n=1 Tax=Branchiostoma lanceolatum TaxID=7740 RepID=A0A8J9ZE24_BRALA|nr:Hypp9115 [Branchiostoma lanceolatum]
MYEQAEPVRSPVSGPSSGRTSGPPPQSPSVHLSSSTGRVRYGNDASDKRDEDQETSDTYEEAEAVKRDVTYTPADQATMQQLQQHQTMVAEMTAKDQKFQAEMAANILKVRDEIQLLQAELAAKDRKIEAEMAAKDRKIETLEQRPYIERCETGVLELPAGSLREGEGGRNSIVSDTFRRAFRKPPVVTLGLTKVDVDRWQNTRVYSAVESVSTTGITVRIGTWHDTRVHDVVVTWMACG